MAEKPVTKNELGRIAGGTPRAVENALAELAAAYDGTGLRLQRSGDEWQIVTAPQHPYTQLLISAIPRAETARGGSKGRQTDARWCPVQLEVARALPSELGFAG